LKKLIKMTEEYKKILKRIYKNADGEVMESIVKRGVNYKFSYGVKTIVLKDLAKEFEQNDDLASELWVSNIRELRIFATLLQPKESLTIQKMNQWANDFNNPEIVEQACINLYKDSTYAEKMAFEWCIDEKEFIQMAGFVLISLITPQIQENVVYLENILDLALFASQTQSLHVKNAIVRALVAVGKLTPEFNHKALDIAERIEKKQTPIAKAIADDAKFQIKFYAESF